MAEKICENVLTVPVEPVRPVSPKLDHRPRYNKLSEVVRRVAPENSQCSLFCGGRKCKYENEAYWAMDHQAIKGIYSHWINDKILAMARPSTYAIEKHGIIEQFNRLGIKTLLNLQCRGEHPHCGPDVALVTPNQDFSYNPQTFMDAGVYFYNYGWRDYGVGASSQILSMVKVMAFALTEGKIAVHCHAGLGRTGVIIACFLIFSQGLPAEEAVHLVRTKRDPSQNLALEDYLLRQQHVLHGDEARTHRYIPKVVDMLLTCLDTAVEGMASGEDSVIANCDLADESPAAVQLAHSLARQSISIEDTGFLAAIQQHREDVNFLLSLVLLWMAALKHPFLNGKFLRKLIKRRTTQADHFNVGQGYMQTLHRFASCLRHYQSLKTSNPFQQDVLAERIMNALTHNNDKLTPQKSHYLYDKLLQCFSIVEEPIVSVSKDDDSNSSTKNE
ncbi:protein tyrosine phosphatase domain-containing protein 1-like isoform X2 [Paramacrobiotus metropolitanus]|uniref:protein tyrosine phosphatase domain-containing protein 1-like isoform X2 n=1 Tax=Paramacrobiotus metropolitanus TaxID=2943436 RepID=UPI002445CC9A|nr:protein tyrosine phosphatase domain-containing protein 1-like isoform X2 [Paramacrobiotus metropolitanus]